MNRFFIDSDRIKQSMVEMDGEDVHHIARVLRLSPGDQVELCDGRGMDYLARINSFDRNRVTVKIICKHPSPGEPGCRVSLYQGIPKGNKMDMVIQKCVELGVATIVPIVTARTVVNLGDQDSQRRKRLRWQKISREAAKQSKRGVIPQVAVPVELSKVATAGGDELKIMLWENEKQNTLKQVFSNQTGDSGAISILIGPEGGFDSHEVKLAMDNGWVTASLGPRILRTETAGMAVLSAIMYQMGELEW